MLPKRSRLTKETIGRHLSKAKRLQTEHFSLIWSVLPSLGRPQVSVTVTKKLAKTAVVRNKLRRRAYSAIKPFVSNIKLGSKVLVRYTNVKNATLSLSSVTEELKAAFTKAGLIK